MVGMDQNDSTHRALVVDSGSGICRCGFAGFLRAVFLYVFVEPQMLRIMAGMNQRDSYAVGRLAQDSPHHGQYVLTGQLCVPSRQWHVQFSFWVYFAPRAVFLLWSLSAGPPLGLHHGRYGPV